MGSSAILASPQRGWPKGRSKPITALKCLVPKDLLSEDLTRLGLTVSAAARSSTVDRGTVSDWMRGKGVPLARTLRKFFDALGIDKAPYKSFLAAAEEAAGRITLICPKCGRPRTMRRGLLKYVGRELRRLPDGSMECLCLRCSRRENGRRAVQLMLERLLKQRYKKRLRGETLYFARDIARNKENAKKERRRLLGEIRPADFNRFNRRPGSRIKKRIAEQSHSGVSFR